MLGYTGQKGHLRIVFRTRFALAAFLLIFAQAQVFAGAAESAAVPGADSGESGFGVSVTLFSTLAAINAAGYDAGIESPLNDRYKVRMQIRDELAKMKIPVLAELRAFYKAHKRPSEAA